MAVPQGGRAAHQPRLLWARDPVAAETGHPSRAVLSLRCLTLCMIKGIWIMIVSAAKYKHINVKRCCYDGAHRNDDENCEQRAARIKKGPICIKAFKECCAIASEFRANKTYKNIQLGRLRKFGIFYRKIWKIWCNFMLPKKAVFMLCLKWKVEKITCKCSSEKKLLSLSGIRRGEYGIEQSALALSQHPGESEADSVYKRKWFFILSELHSPHF